MSTDLRYLTISQMARMFAKSRDTIRQKMKAAGVKSIDPKAVHPRYDMSVAGPAIFK